MQVSATSHLAVTQTAALRQTQRAPAQSPAAEETAVPRELPPLKLLQGKDLAAATADFAADLGKMFRAAGISVPPEPMLTSDLAGRVVVANDHPDKARIEAMFEDAPDMRNRFAELSGAHSLQRAVENYDDFVAAYERLQGNPQAQAALVEQRIARNDAQFYMRIGSEGAEPFFGGLGRISA